MAFRKRHIIPSVLLAFAPAAQTQAQPVLPDTQSMLENSIASSTGLPEAIHKFLQQTAVLPPADCHSMQSDGSKILDIVPPVEKRAIAVKFLNAAKNCSTKYAPFLLMELFFKRLEIFPDLKQQAATQLFDMIDQLDELATKEMVQQEILLLVGGCLECEESLRDRAIDRWKKDNLPITPDTFSNINRILIGNRSSYGYEKAPSPIEQVIAAEFLNSAAQLDPDDQETAYFHAAKYGDAPTRDAAIGPLEKITNAKPLAYGIYDYFTYSRYAIPDSPLEDWAAERWAALVSQLPAEEKMQALRHAVQFGNKADTAIRLRAAALLAEESEQKRNPAPVSGPARP